MQFFFPEIHKYKEISFFAYKIDRQHKTGQIKQGRQLVGRMCLRNMIL